MCGFSLPWNSTYFPARRNFRNSYNSPLGDKTLEKFWTRWKNVCRADLLSILKLLNLLVQPGRSGALWFLVETILWVAVVIAKSKIQDTQNEHCELLQSWDLILFWTHFSLILCLFYPMIQWWHIQTIYVQLTLFLQTRSDAIASIPSRGWESLGTGEGVAGRDPSCSPVNSHCQALTGESMSWGKRGSGQIDNNTEQFRTCQLT